LPAQLAIAGALDFWKAAGEIWPTRRAQCCWLHKAIDTKADAQTAFDAFIDSYRGEYQKATECLRKKSRCAARFL
jgi:hypothetical protein